MDVEVEFMTTHKTGKWLRAVFVEIEFEEETAVLQIDNTREAAECLSNLWPYDDGIEFLNAVRLCSAAMDGRTDDESARVAFMAAAMEADIAVPIH